jgi:TolB protein
MIRRLHCGKKFPPILIILSILSILVVACTGIGVEAQSQPTVTMPAEDTPQPTSTSKELSLPMPSVTPSPLPLTQETTDTKIADEGYFVLAMRDGEHHHLFAYHPVNYPLTRLTTGEFDYDYPAISPDGSTLAFCANSTGKWEVYTLNLLTGLEVQVSQADGYACAPTWSPDGLWLAYETLADGKLIILVHSATDRATPPMRLTGRASNNFDPAWSPEGRKIAFVTDRNGRLEIWLADLNVAENRLNPLITSSEASFTSPDWSLDGQSLAWSKITDQSVIERRNIKGSGQETILLGAGSKPIWMINDQGTAALLVTPNGYELIAYHDNPTRLLFPAIHLPGEVTSFDWQSGSIVSNMATFVERGISGDPFTLVPEESITPNTTSERSSLVSIYDLKAPEASLADTIDDRFMAMREELNQELGWDFLGILQSAATSLPADDEVAIHNNWLYTGRGISVNLDPLDAGWMLVSREDFTGRTFWRVWLKCMAQDGTCGIPLKEPVWDFNARSNNEMDEYENGGDTGAIPEGYWFDFTAFALRYGWERLPAASNWRNYFPATNMSIFALKEGLTWQQAMEQIYSSNELERFLP